MRRAVVATNVRWTVKLFPAMLMLTLVSSSSCLMEVTEPTDLEVESLGAALTGEGSYSKAFVLYDGSGRALQTQGTTGSGLVLDAALSPSTVVLRTWIGVPVSAPQNPFIASGDSLRLLEFVGRYLRHETSTPNLGANDGQSTWRLSRTAGTGRVKMGDTIRLRPSDTDTYLKSSNNQVTISSGTTGANWTFGCMFSPGTFTTDWTRIPKFARATTNTTRVDNAVAWLTNHTRTMRTPVGNHPLPYFLDGSFPPLGENVSYLNTDALWTWAALIPYDGTRAANIKTGLLAMGWFGNGLYDTLFHAYPQPAHKPLDTDLMHGKLLADCATSTTPLQINQVRTFSMGVDAGFTNGHPSQFIDSAVYQALNDFWNGSAVGAQIRMGDVVNDQRSLGNDRMFWDSQNRLLVDESSRCGYDRFLNGCQSACNPNTCGGCDGTATNCRYVNASYKIALLIYALRVVQIDTQFSTTLSQMTTRLWEAQNTDGGISHTVSYTASSQPLRGGATAEATAAAVLAHTFSRATNAQ